MLALTRALYMNLRFSLLFARLADVILIIYMIIICVNDDEHIICVNDDEHHDDCDDHGEV